jgi:hypothetical protein
MAGKLQSGAAAAQKQKEMLEHMNEMLRKKEADAQAVSRQLHASKTDVQNARPAEHTLVAPAVGSVSPLTKESIDSSEQMARRRTPVSIYSSV